jgi:hypothetical protein
MSPGFRHRPEATFMEHFPFQVFSKHIEALFIRAFPCFALTIFRCQTPNPFPISGPPLVYPIRTLVKTIRNLSEICDSEGFTVISCYPCTFLQAEGFSSIS